MRKYAVIGKGKTGQAVLSVLGPERTEQVFCRSNPVSANALLSADAAIVFIPAEGFLDMIPLLLEARIPVVCGTTGFKWPVDFSTKLKERGTAWIAGSNFSPGMNLFFTIANLLKRNRMFLGNPRFSIHEVHHALKLDSPSGTALRLAEVLGGEVKINAERLGDHRGLHELEINSSSEKLFFRHEALDRKAFGEGAVFAADELLPLVPPGLHFFESLIEKKLLEST